MAVTQPKISAYKQTKIGLIPEDWEVGKFSDLADKSDRWSITGGPFGSNLKTTDYTPTGVRIIQLQNIGDGYFNDKEKIYTSHEKAKELLACCIYSGEIILSKMGDPVARACIMPDIDKIYLMASDGIRLKVDLDAFDKYFVFLMLNNIEFRKRAIRVSTGSTRQRIGLGDLKKIPIPLPPLPEQQKIAEILSTWDETLSELDQLIAAKKQLKKGLMQQLLTGQKRFPEFVPKGGTRYKQSKLGLMPEDWEMLKVGDVTKFHKQGYYTKDAYVANGEIALLRGTDMQNPTILYNDAPRLNISEKDFEAYKVELNDFLFVRSGAIGRYGIVSELNNKAIFGSYLINFRFSDHILNQYFGYYYESSYTLKQLAWITQGSSNININADNIKSIRIPLPPLPEQQKIAATLSAIDNEIQELETQKTAYQTQKKGLMQVLLTGRVRVKVN